MRLPIARSIQHALAALERHVAHAEKLIAEVLEAVVGVGVVALAFEAEFRAVGDDHLVVGVDGVVELRGIVSTVFWEKGWWGRR